MRASPLPGIHDILYHILAHFSADLKVSNAALYDRLESQSARQALARLARAHSSFTRPVLAVLWRYLRTDKALLHLLTIAGIAHEPSVENEQSRDCDSQNKHLLEFCGMPAPDSQGWVRFQGYASLVREITLDPFVGVPAYTPPILPLQDTFWCQLSSALGNNRPILPRLRAVSLLSVGTPFRFEALDLGPLHFLNPSIRELTVMLPHTCYDAEVPLRRVLSTSLSSIPNLESLSVEAAGPLLDIHSLPQSHPRLRRLELALGFEVNPKHLNILASLSNLEHLSITLSARAPGPTLPVAFPALRSLAVSSADFSAIGALIAHMAAPELQSISLTETHWDTGPTYHAMPGHLRALVAKCPCLTAFRWNSTNLRVFDSVPPTTGLVGMVAPELPLAVLVAPLLALRTLRSFAVRFRGPVVPYSPADLRVLAEAWPALETFDLHHDRDCDRDSQLGTAGGTGGQAVSRYADVDSILGFARCCPRLHELRLTTVRLHFSDVDTGVDTSVTSLSDASIGHQNSTSVSMPQIPWPCTVVVEHVLCPGEQEQELDVAVDRRESLLRSWMQRVLPSATVSFPLRFTGSLSSRIASLGKCVWVA